MGAVTFSLDPRLVKAIQSVLPLSVLIETGTFKGDTVSLFQYDFEKVISIELSEELCQDAVKRFADAPNVRILHGHSPDRLSELRIGSKDEGVLYWLDAHWCAATGTAGELSQCPLMEELQAIGKLNEKSVILIDDARLFLAPPLAPHEISNWPSFQTLLANLLTLSSEHELMIINDVIAFFPKNAKSVMRAYAQSFGVDWLVAANALKINESLAIELKLRDDCIKDQNIQLLEKDECIKDLNVQLLEKDECINDLNVQLLEKDKLINEQHQKILQYRSYAKYFLVLFKLVSLIIKKNRRVVEIFSPRLGNLKQYIPRPLTPLKQVISNAKSSSILISIVTPSFEQGHFISSTIRSVVDQQYPSLEYFVQDGGSTDSTLGVLEKFNHVITGWVSEKDSGQSQAINRGFQKTTGDIMCWLNSDDLLLPGALQTVANCFQKNPDIDVLYGNRLLIDENDKEIGRWVMPGHDGKVLSWVDYVPQETMFWRRSIWERVGGQIDESFSFAMDWDLLVRFRDAGANFAHIPRFLGAFRVHEHQKTSAQINQVGQMEMERIRTRLLGRVPTQQEIRKAVTPFLLRHIFVDLIYRISIRMRGGK